MTIDSRPSVSCEMAASRLAEGGLTPGQVAGVVKKAAALYTKYAVYTNKVLDPDEVLWVASLDSCCVFSLVAASLDRCLKLRAFYSSIVL